MTPSFSFQSSQSTGALLCAAFEIVEFFVGTTDETTSFFICRCLKNSATTLLESSAVGIRAGLETRSLDANASFAYELLTSINKYRSDVPRLSAETQLRAVKHPRHVRRLATIAPRG